MRPKNHMWVFACFGGMPALPVSSLPTRDCQLQIGKFLEIWGQALRRVEFGEERGLSKDRIPYRSVS